MGPGAGVDAVQDTIGGPIALGLCARVQVGNTPLAVTAPAVVQVVDAAQAIALPRRAGALCEALPTRWGVLPLVDLALWLPCGAACSEGTRALVLRDEAGRHVALRVAALGGVQRHAGLVRLHHDERPEELFQSTVSWHDGSAPTPWLEVPRLMALSQLWAAALPAPGLRAAGATPGGEAAGAAESGAGVPPRAVPHALLRTGGTFWALPAQHLVQVLRALPLEFALPPGPAVRGIVSWQGRKLPVLDLAAWGRAQGLDDRSPAATADAAVMAVVAQGDLALALRVDAVQQLLDLPASGTSTAREPLRRLLTPSVGEVQVVDVEILFSQLPEVDISRPRGAAAALPGGPVRATPTPHHGPAGGPAHLLFEADTRYAAHVRNLLQVLPLPAALSERLRTAGTVTLPWRGASIPVVALPAYSGQAAADPPRVALVLQLPNGQRAALAVQTLLGWVGGAALETGGMRMANTGQLSIVTVTLEGQRQSHVVVDLAEVAQALT